MKEEKKFKKEGNRIKVDVVYSFIVFAECKVRFSDRPSNEKSLALLCLSNNGAEVIRGASNA